MKSLINEMLVRSSASMAHDTYERAFHEKENAASYSILEQVGSTFYSGSSESCSLSTTIDTSSRIRII